MTSKNKEHVCVDVFMDHWNKALYFINNFNDVNSSETIFKHIDIMIDIIIKQCDENSMELCDILDFCQENAIFQTLLIHFNRDTIPGNIREIGIVNQLKVYDNLINFLPTDQMLRKNIILPILRLLEECSIRSSVKIEQLSVHLLFQLCVLVTRSEKLFTFLKDVSNSDFQEPFYFVGLLIQMIHRDKDIGRLSQEGLLLMFNFCKEDDNSDLVDYICIRSDFSAILTTVLSGLYSSFPRKLDSLSEDWQQLTRDFIHSIPEIKHSLDLLDFCNLALKMSNPRIQNDILEFLYSGFLSPVIGPSLHQNSLEETISATAYLELFLRHLRHPLLIKLFLQFILTERQENYVVLDSLINRLSSITMDSVEGMYTLGVVTLSLFRTMLGFHCEDVIFHLVLKYLIPCNHLIKQKWSSLVKTYPEKSEKKHEEDESFSNKMNEDFSASADEFLKISLGIYSDDSDFIHNRSVHTTSQLELEQRRASQSPVLLNNLKTFSLASPFHSYLQTASILVSRRILATDMWKYSYDGQFSPPPDVFDHIDESMAQSWTPQHLPSHALLLGDGEILRRSSETIIIEGEEEQQSRKLFNKSLTYVDVDVDVDADADEESEVKQIRRTENNGRRESKAEASSSATATPGTVGGGDVGYFSNNGSSGSTIYRSHKNLVSSMIGETTGRMTLQNDDDIDTGSDGSRQRIGSSGSHAAGRSYFDSSTLASKLSKSTQSIYKLHYGSCAYSDEEEEEVEEEDKVNEFDSLVKKSEDNVQLVKGKTEENIEEEEEEYDDKETMQRSQINLENVLLSSPDDCNLSDFIVSLSLLQLDQKVQHQCSNWDLDWNNLGLLLDQHNIDILSHSDQECFNNVNVPSLFSDLTNINFRCADLGEENENINKDDDNDDNDSTTKSTPTNEMVFKKRLQSFDNSLYISPSHVNYSVTLGPFLTAIFQRLSVLTTNTFFMNLLVTGIVSDLASYPNPLLKNLLLDVDVILQPHLSKLVEVLTKVRSKFIDHTSDINNWETLLESAYEYLFYRICPADQISGLLKSRKSSRLSLTIPEEDFNVKLVDLGIGSINSFSGDFHNLFSYRRQSESKPRRTPFGILNRKKKPTYPVYKFPVSKFCYSKKKHINEYEAQRFRNLAYNWILYDEFCKELASLCQEHTLHCFF